MSISRTEVLRYLQKREGEIVYRGDIVEALYEGVEFPDRKVTANVWSLINVDNEPIEVVRRGQAWRYRRGAAPGTTKSRRLFEEIGMTRSGSLIVEGEDGTLYRLEEM